MDKTNKQIILKEIDKWRNNRLLPTEYCDFLSNLYAEGKTFRHDEKNKQKMIGRWIPDINWKRLLGSLILGTLLLLFVLHFTTFPNWMQIGVLIFCTIFFYWLSFFVRLPITLLRTVFQTFACFFVAMDGYYFIHSMGLNESISWIIGVLVFVLIVWILTGVAGESRMITSAAWLGIGILYELGIQYAKGVAWSAYGFNTAYWIAFSAISIGMGIFLGKSKVYVSPVWAITGVFAIMVPDVLYLLSEAKPSFLVDVTAFLKISLLITFVIVFREGIQKWLDSFSNRLYNKSE